jgi:hypothetical protein
MTSGELQFSQFDLEDIKQFNQLELEASFSDVEEEEDFRLLVAQDLGNIWSGRTSVTSLVPQLVQRVLCQSEMPVPWSEAGGRHTVQLV